nr:chromobox protein homolog 1-like [Leptinotarsa decemlineata]
MIGGVRHYLIRWKGYEEESDTWEPEDTLECADLIVEYKERKKKGKAEKGKKSPKKDKKEPKPADWDENEDFEVDRILEVHHKRDGKREFLVSWKGYSHSDNSWEPEENMDCKDLINRFMAKVEKAREMDEKELRVNRKQVQRYTLSMQERSRRLSKRFSGKERVQYHDAE